MEFGFDVDYHALAQSAPEGFAILQLITSNDRNLKYLWKKYTDSDGKVRAHVRIKWAHVVRAAQLI